jgi:exopolysaccharide biosynthesis protein
MPAVSRNVLIIVALGLGIVAAIIGFVVREPIERSIFLHTARGITGLDSLDASHLDHDGDTYVLSDVRAAAPDGSFTFIAPQVRVSGHPPHYDIALAHPNLRFDPATYRDADRARVRDAFASAGTGGVAKITVDAGTLAVGPVTTPAVLYADAIDGSLEVHTSRATFDGTLNLEAKAQAFPIVGKTVEEDGAFVQTWSAQSIPIEPFVAFVAPNAPSHPVSGMLRDLTVDDGPHFHASARLDNVTVAIGDHALHGLHGKLIAVDDGIGTGGVAGFLDNVTFRAVGEVHDLRSHYRWLAEGTNDLRNLAKLATTIAAEPVLRGPVELEAIAPGLAYGQYHMLGDHGPLAVSVLAADPAEKTLRFDTAIAEDHVVSNGERTSAMGLRTGAVGGVNGDYFDIGRTYQPQGMLVRNGELVRGPTDRAVLAIDRDKHVTVGEFHMTGAFETSHGKVPVTEFNDWPPGYVSVITPSYGKELRPADATFVALEPLGGTSYRVTSVQPGTAAIPASFGVAIGKLAKIPIPTVGETVKLNYATNPPLTNAVAAIGGGPILLKDGLPYEDPHAPAPDERDYRWPVVALVQTKDGYLDLVAVDGRHPERSVGMTRPEFAELLERFGGSDAMALDSGGSVTLVARAPGDANVTVRNVPSDNSAERWVSDALFLYSTAPRPSIVVPAIATTPLPEERPTP